MSKTKNLALKRQSARSKWFKGRRLLRSAINFPRKNWFIPREVNKDGVNIAYGPRSGILFLNDRNERLIGTPLEKLGFIFTHGYFDKLAPAMADFIPYINEKLGSCFIKTYVEKKDAVYCAEEYGYVYVIDASKSSNLSCVPNASFNTRNKRFMQSIDLDFCCITMPMLYMLGGSIKPEFIVGAFATQYLAFSLNISEGTLIINPNYGGNIAATIKKLKVHSSVAFQNCAPEAVNYTEAKTKYESGPTSLNNRFLRVQAEMKRVEALFGLEIIINVFPRIKRIMDGAPFTALQRNAIVQKLLESKKAAGSVRKAAVACAQFEQGFYQEQGSLPFLPDLVRREIYSYVYPIVQANTSTYKRARSNFLKNITHFFKEYQCEGSQVNVMKGQQPTSENKVNFSGPSTSAL